MPPDSDARASFHELFATMLPQVRSWLRRQGLDHEVEDVAADVFTVVWTRWADLPTDAGERRAWVFGVARRKMLRAHQSVATAQDPDRLRRFHHEQHPQDPAVAVAGADWVSQALASLPAAEREAVAMTFLADLTPAQAGLALGCSTSAVTTRLSRARAHLAQFAATHHPDLDATGRTR